MQQVHEKLRREQSKQSLQRLELKQNVWKSPERKSTQQQTDNVIAGVLPDTSQLLQVPFSVGLIFLNIKF